jgi:hypothetical protein
VIKRVELERLLIDIFQIKSLFVTDRSKLYAEAFSKNRGNWGSFLKGKERKIHETSNSA